MRRVSRAWCSGLAIVLMIAVSGGVFATPRACPNADESAFLDELKVMIAGRKIADVAASVRYPIVIHYLKDGRHLTIQDEREWVAHYDEIFDGALLAALVNPQPAELVCNYRGVGIGNGRLWFRRTNGRYVIVTINQF
jgi:hypothetical protein